MFKMGDDGLTGLAEWRDGPFFLLDGGVSVFFSGIACCRRDAILAIYFGGMAESAIIFGGIAGSEIVAGCDISHFLAGLGGVVPVL